ncbi:MAG: hypothetical protein SP4CHLAM5_09380 [Chlamydiia bacterium]|nr:hypothetical protein [Chlamydiia bacterium]MCH9618797.1 hypothetical protein [Chlamydiia bacterium]MCH9624610.1 hypothetical protein [Chlamydiia bacterium]
MIGVIFYNFIIISILSFFTSWALIEAIVFLCGIASYRSKVSFMLLPIGKLFYDICSWNVSKWAAVYGMFPHMGKANSRILNMTVGGPFPSFKLNFEYINGMGFTIADYIYGVSSDFWLQTFFMAAGGYYGLNLCRRLRVFVKEVLFIRGLIEVSRPMQIHRSSLKKVKLLIAKNYYGSPFTVGLFKKKIIFPEDLYYKYSKNQLEAIIAHEMAHIKHGDFLVNLVMIFCSLIFAHLPMGIYVKRVSLLQEHAADREAMNKGISKIALSEALMKCSNLQNNAACAFLSNTHLLNRIKAIGKYKAFRRRPLAYVGYIAAIYLSASIYLGKIWIV